MLIADGPTVVEFLLFNMLLPFLGALVFFGSLAAIGKWLAPKITRAWRRSIVRNWLISLSGGMLSIYAGLIGNGFVVLFCLPLTRVPEGSGIKPMKRPLVFALVGAVSGASGGKALADP